VKDGAGQKLAYVYYEEEPGRRFSSQAAHQRRGAADRGECSLYSHGGYRHCAPVTSTTPLSISGREEGSAAISGRGEGTGTATFAGRSEGTGTAARGESRECTGAVLNVQQWLVPTQTRCALGNLARASLSVMQAGEPLASDGPIMDARASARIKRAVICPKPAPFCGQKQDRRFCL
jgi:hypothetical protein